MGTRSRTQPAFADGQRANGVALLLKDGEFVLQNGLFAGYSAAVWLLVTNNALNGLAISAILKFADNIVRVFAHTAAMMLTMVLELAFMGAPFSPQLLVSITIVMCSTFLYNTKPSPPRTIASKGMQKLEEEQTKLELDETTGELEPVDSLEGRTRANPTIRA